MTNSKLSLAVFLFVAILSHARSLSGRCAGNNRPQ
jgi:hypothetical protein